MNDTGAVQGFATFDGGLGFASAKVFAEKPAGGNPQRLSGVKPVEGALRIPESLKQYEIPWSRFEPCGGWKFWNCLHTELLPESERVCGGFKKTEEAFNSARHNFSEAVRQCKDICERTRNFTHFASNAVISPKGETVYDLLKQLNAEAVRKDPTGITLDFERWLLTTRGMAAMVEKLSTVALSDASETAENLRGRKAEMEATEAYMEFNVRFYDSEAYAFALEYVPLKYKTKVFRDAYRNSVACSLAYAKMSRKPTGDEKWDSLVSASGNVVADMNARIQNNLRDMKRIKSLLATHGTAFWERACR